MRLKHLMVAGALAVASLGGLLLQNNAMAVKCPAGSLRENDPSVNSLAECNIAAGNSQNNLFETVNGIINVVLGVVGIVAVVVIIIGGVSYLISQGDAGKVAKAKNTILYGVIGMFVALLAFAVVNFLLTSVFSPGQTPGKPTTTTTTSTGSGAKNGLRAEQEGATPK